MSNFTDDSFKPPPWKRASTYVFQRRTGVNSDPQPHMTRRLSLESAVRAANRELAHAEDDQSSGESPSASRRSFVRQTFNPTAWASATGDKDDDALLHVHKWHSLAVSDDETGSSVDVHPGSEPLIGDKLEPRFSSACASLQLKRFFAFLIANMLVLIEAVPFGLAFFPATWEDFPAPRALGIQMFLLSSAICQAVFAVSSKFDMATGLMMCENVPFMNQIATEIVAELRSEGREAQALPTVLVAFALSTVVVGLSFYALGSLKMGAVIGLIPPYIIQGCIGGIGVFITQTGMEISTGLTWGWHLDSLSAFVASQRVVGMWLLPLGCSLTLRLASRAVHSPMLTPIFFVAIPAAFHAALSALGLAFTDPAVQPWFFDKEETPEWWLMWELLDFKLVAWDVLPSQLGTFAALTIFSLIHVPINIPSLCMTTDLVADIDHELKVHGVANMLAGAVGTLQNYLCFSNSALYYKCGGGGLLYRGLLSVTVFVFFLVGPSVISIIPRCMAGALMLHIGTELVREALVEPFASLDRIEYASVCLITLVMTVAGMTQGLVVAAILALLTFVLQSSRVPVVASWGHGARVRSSAWRSITDLDVLAEQGWRVHLIQLQGVLFFGNFPQVSTAISNVLATRHLNAHEPPVPGDQRHMGYLYIVIDMSAITTMDTAAAKALEKTYLELRDLGMAHLALVLPKPLTGTGSLEEDPAYAGLRNSASVSSKLSQSRARLAEESPMLHLNTTLDGAVEWCEDCILARYNLLPSAPVRVRPSLSVEFIIQSFAEQFASASEASSGAQLQRSLLSWFELQEVKQGEVIWREGDKPQQVCVLVSGKLRAEDETGAVQDTDCPGCMFGEFGLITGDRRQNTLVALTDARLDVLTAGKWAQLQASEPKLAFLLASVALKYAGNRLHHVAISTVKPNVRAIPV